MLIDFCCCILQHFIESKNALMDFNAAENFVAEINDLHIRH